MPDNNVSCRSCDWELVRMGTQYYCQQTQCSRFCLPTNEYGDTPDEHEQRCEDEGVERERRQADGDASYHGGSHYSSERMDAARRMD